MLCLSHAEIHLWFVFCGEITREDLLARYRELLSPQEREQEGRLYSPRDRHRYRLTRALVRTVLSRYAPVQPEEWVFESDSHGKPHIANQHSAATDISFNISHTRDVILLGVTHRSALGVDVETISERSPALKLAERYFSPAEVRSLRAVPAGAQLDRFFDYWTLKESYIKARGLGLSIPLDLFGFDIQGANLSLQVRSELKDTADRWRCWLIKPSDDHVGAVCVERGGSQVLVARKVVPLLDEQPFECPQVARSD
jgi:4'-phosphopantetheinyl transferase